MNLSGTRRFRLSLSLGLGMLLAAVFACLNPRPDDEPSAAASLDSSPSTENGGSPTTGLPDALPGGGVDVNDGQTPTLGPADPSPDPDPPLSGADAGAPDAGPQDVSRDGGSGD